MNWENIAPDLVQRVEFVRNGRVHAVGYRAPNDKLLALEDGRLIHLQDQGNVGGGNVLRCSLEELDAIVVAMEWQAREQAHWARFGTDGTWMMKQHWGFVIAPGMKAQRLRDHEEWKHKDKLRLDSGSAIVAPNIMRVATIWHAAERIGPKEDMTVGALLRLTNSIVAHCRVGTMHLARTATLRAVNPPAKALHVNMEDRVFLTEVRECIRARTE